VRTRFRLDDEDLDQITGWVAATGVRWGFDAAGRAPFALAGEEQNTWDFGLDRLLSGVAVSADGPLSIGGHTLPYDDIGSGSIDLAGRLAEAIGRLEAAVDALADARSASAWTTALREAVLDLTDVPMADAWQVGDLDRVLAEASQHAPDDLPLRLADVRVLLADRLAGRPGRASFRTGGLTVCTMVPMRSVPHRVVCLVGLDDDSFPRQQSIDGDDVLARTPMTGERDSRSEDRQLLLDAVMAAGERLVITYTGADERSGERRPPAVPLGELIDAAAETVADPGATGPDGDPDSATPSTDPEEAAATASAALGEVRHPLQPFDPRNFAAGALTGDQPFSFDRASLEGATALLGERSPRPPLLDAPLPVEDTSEISLAQLVDFVQAPARTFLRERLGLAVSWDADEVSDRVPVDIDSLGLWAIGERGARARLAGRPAEEVWTAELLRGELPPSGLARHTLTPVCQRVEALVHDVEALRGDEPARTVHVDITLAAGRRITGAVDGVHGDRLVTAGYSRVGAKQLLAAWVRLLALTAGQPDPGGWQASIRGTTPKGTSGRDLGSLDPELARARLGDLVELYLLGRTVALPLPPKTGYAYAQVVHSDARKTGAARQAARGEWEPNARGFSGENDDRWWRLAVGDAAPLERLLDPVAGPGTDLQALAPRLWDPLLDNLGGGR
jgi:exodeoxyribonuclease V gamma subunit